MLAALDRLVGRVISAVQVEIYLNPSHLSVGILEKKKIFKSSRLTLIPSASYLSHDCDPQPHDAPIKKANLIPLVP